MKTFVLEVSAGHERGATDASLAPADPRAPHSLAAAEDPGDDGAPSFDLGSTELLDEPADDEIGPQMAEPLLLPTVPATARKRVHRMRRRGASGRPRGAAAAATAVLPPRRLSAWSASLGVHGLMVAALSLVTISQVVRREQMDLVMAPAATEELELVAAETPPDHELESDLPVEEFAEEALGTVVDPGTPTLGMELGAGTLGELTSEMALVGGGGGGAASSEFGGLGGAGGMYGNGTGGTGGFGSGLGAAPTAKFFGAKIEGRRIVFVLDNSGSMQAGRLETVIAELLQTVNSLEPDQQFYVAFYSDAAYPMFYPDPAEDFIPPTDRNKERLARWLDTVELCLGDAVQEALAGAISIEPDCMFLLSDGRIQGEKKMAFLLHAAGGAFPIHTVGVGLSAGAEVSRENLRQIALANGGEFREAP
ncbi:MAG TPA: VWA domain-containing protein, partial [Lacipirellulaceae bacterium]|nr:VWA domain-containing protein [Lacipirellulaceae bacterium]